MTGWTDDGDVLAYPREPELVLGLVAPIGTPVKSFLPILSKSFSDRGYEVTEKKLSGFASVLNPGRSADLLPAYQRYHELIQLGNKIRVVSGRDDILALYAAAAISGERPDVEPRYLAKTVFIVDQLKRPEEAYRLRRIYGDNFLLLGLSCPRNIRRNHLIGKGMTEQEADDLIERDRDEAASSGQRVSDTFHLADVFIEVPGNASDNSERTRVKSALDRFLDLIFGVQVVTPTREEYGMFLAYSAGLRSSSLARQVGAAILTDNTELLGIGANEVPCYGGGLYWGDSHTSARDHERGYDESDRMKRAIVQEMLPVVMGESWTTLPSVEQGEKIEQTLTRLKGTRVTSLTEFARAVHAEMEALSSAGRVGVSTRDATLFSTTFPCHVCAKHIVAAGIKRVIYIEPYAKSRALEMYGDSIYVRGDSEGDITGKVTFESFVGVAPRRYPDLFGRYNQEGRQLNFKDKTGDVKLEALSLRIPFSPVSYIVREALAAESLKNLQGVIDANIRKSDSEK